MKVTNDQKRDADEAVKALGVFRSRLPVMDFEELVASLQNERARHERAEARFFMHLVAVEDRLMDFLKGNGYRSFESFLKSYGLCDAMRYREFRVGVLKLGEHDALAVGLEATRAAGDMADEVVEPYVTTVKQWSVEHGGMLPTRETARDIARQLEPRASIPRPLKNLQQIEDLKAENKALRARIRELEKENSELRARLDGAEAAE